jgi:integrase
VRKIPLVAQLAHLLAAHKQATPFAADTDWVFATACGTPYGHRNVVRRVLQRAARSAGLDQEGWPPLRFHDLRHYADGGVMRPAGLFGLVGALPVVILSA